ncbi:MAG: flagellar basal body rod protein FlgC [Armatimonadota bacterium]
MSTFDIAASGLAAQRFRLDVVSGNLANAETTRTPEGGPYRRQQVVFEAGEDGGVQLVEAVPDERPLRSVYQPGHPDANADGYVEMPNVNPVEEMVDLVAATRSYEANVTALNATKGMIKKALEIGRG